MFIYSNVYAGNKIKYSVEDILFSNAEEQGLFKEISNGAPNNLANFLKIMALARSDMYSAPTFGQFNNKLNATIATLKNVGTSKKKPAKHIKTIYSTIHNDYFRKYELNPSFQKLITQGIYNCVTATFLYSYILEHLSIPYKIKEAPNHVYLVAYPDTDQIVMESTNPMAGFIEYNVEFKKKFTQNLKDSKLISEAEYNSKPVNELFEKYYLNENDISLKELIGAYYGNRGIELYQKEKYQDAFEEFKKAYLLYPSEQMKFNLLQSCLMSLSNVVDYNSQDLDNYQFATNFLNKGIDENSLYNFFLQTTDYHLSNQNNEKLYDEFYNKYSGHLTDSSYRCHIDFAYHFEKGRIYLIKGNYEKGFQHTYAAFVHEPNKSTHKLI